MFQRVKEYLPMSLLYSLLLIAAGWHAGSAAGEKAQPPLIAATPATQNMDGRMLEAAVAKIEAGEYGDIDALLVIRNDNLVLEKYFSPEYHGRDYLRPVLSTTKSIASALIGIAIGQGRIDGVQGKLFDYFPEYSDIRDREPAKRKITLENVLTMTAGFQWNELAIAYADPRNDFNRMLREQDWVRYVLATNMSHLPGEAMVYNSGCTLLLSSILQKATGHTAEQFAARYLFGPLGIDQYTWSLASAGLTNTFTGLAMRRRDMAKIGILFLHEGRWLGHQLIAREWVRQSTRKQVIAGPDTDGSAYGYGYQWWQFQDQDSTVSSLGINDVYFTWGYGGQFIFVIPHLNMVVVSTGDLYGADHRRAFDLLRDYIFPAVLD